jgi:hypothetical protein
LSIPAQSSYAQIGRTVRMRGERYWRKEIDTRMAKEGEAFQMEAI